MIYFLKKGYKEVEIYAVSLKNTLNKALAVVKNQIVNCFGSITEQIFTQISEEINEETKNLLSSNHSYTLFYSKFRSNSQRIKSLIEQLEQRANTSPLSDYKDALSECQSFYASQRRLLLQNCVLNTITELTKKYNRDTCSLVRSGCSFMVRLCQDESKLFSHFFTESSIHLK